MQLWWIKRCAPVCLVLAANCAAALGQSVSNYAVQVTAAVQTNPPQITLSWVPDPFGTDYSVSRKLRDDWTWGPWVALPANATNFVDSDVVVGGSYEYLVYKTIGDNSGEGYVYAGIQTPVTEDRGKMILLVDSTQATNLAQELARLQQDLVGDGWIVLRHDVASTNSVTNIKALITTNYNSDPANVKAVFLFGHVPVPYSGDLKPDGHDEHRGAWPADVYYGDMEGTWTDSSVNTTNASDARNRNVPGDGKFDQSDMPWDVALQVGRVDLANLPAFAMSETELLRRYLNKDHNFRHGLLGVQRRGLIDDNLGVFHYGMIGVEAFAANGWRNYPPFFWASNSVTSSSWFGTLSTNSFLWGYGCGSGTFTSCSGVGSTSDLAANDPRVVFTMFFGSWFGDWDSPDNFMRAALATPTYTLASVWAGRPYWYFHHMGLGETIGFSACVSQNNYYKYGDSLSMFQVHVALMGDPTLRLHPVVPPSALLVVTNGSGGVDLSWNASPDAVVGYHVYSAPTNAGPFTRLTTNLLSGTTFTDLVVTTSVYMVRAVKLEETPSGSYYNPSQGIFQNLSNSFGPLVLTITAQSTNKVYGAPLPTFTALYSGFTNGDTPASLTSLPVLSTPATSNSPAGSYPITASGASSSNYAIRYVPGTLTILPAATAGSVTSSTNPALPGQAVTFTLTLSAVAPGAGTPTGTVQFKIVGANVPSPVSLSNGVAAYTTTNLVHGWHAVVAEYAGDGNFTGTTNELAGRQLINTPPVAGPDAAERDPNTGVKVSIATLLSNDSDADTNSLTFIGVSATSANGGTVVSNGGWAFYTPAAEFTNTDTFTYTISDGWAAPVTGVVTVNIRTDNGPSPNLTISDRGNGWYAIRGNGIPDRTYRIQSADSARSTNWQTLGPAAADPYGIFQLNDTNGSPQRFYRSVYP